MGQGGTGVVPAGSETAIPVMFGRAFTLDRVGVEVTTGAASTVMRLGLRADDGTYRPGDLITEWTSSATLDCSTTGIKELTVSTALSAFVRYWIVYKVTGSNITCRSVGTPWPVFPASQAEAYNPVGRYGYERSQAGGAFPTTWTGNSYGGGGLHVVGRSA